MALEPFSHWKDKVTTALIALLASILGMFGMNVFNDFKDTQKVTVINASKILEQGKDVQFLKENIAEIKDNTKKISDKLDDLLVQRK